MDYADQAFLFRTSALAKSYRDDEPTAVGVSRHGVRFGPITIPRGGILALVGESGTGKTTLFNLLSGLDAPDRTPHQTGLATPPNIRLDLGGPPIDIAEHPGAFPRARVGFVFQSGFLLNNAGAALNLALPSAQQGRPTRREELVHRLAAVGIDGGELEERAWKFSGGEAQRIAFVRALAHDPQLIFADEPTSNVDYRNAVSIMQQLRTWVRDPAHPGRTVLWITHALRLAAAIADAVLVLHRDNDAPLHPVCLPGDPESDLEHRVETLERWTYDKAAMAADAPPPFAGLATGAGVPGEPAEAGRWQGTAVRLGTVLKVGLSEVFSRHPAQKIAAVREQVNPVLSVGGVPARGRPLRTAYGWLASFGQRSAVLALILITILGASGLAIFDLVDAHFERSVNDPRNCHVIIKTSRGSGRGACYGDLECLSQRPWSAAPVSAATSLPEPVGEDGWDNFDTPAVGVPPRASCEAGDAAYGRIYARGWNIALADNGRCPKRATNSVLLLTADQREPIWSQVRLLAGSGGRGGESLAGFIDAQQAVYNDQIFLAAEQVQALGIDEMDQVVDQTLCLFEAGWPEPIELKVYGVLDEVPNWERNRFAGFIPNYTYDAFQLALGRGAGLVRDPTHIALYFSSDQAESLRAFLIDQGYIFVAENLQKIGRLVETAGIFKGIVSGFLALISLLLTMLTAMSVLHYLSANAQSFALLKAFGMSRRFMFGILLVEIGVGWLLAVASIGTALLLADLLGGDVWWRFNDLILSAQTLWRPFLLSAAAVWLLSVGVSLVLTLLWWRQNRYVAEVLKAG
ncbi:ATP-binding cassette domain-containing protein [Candidatus Thiosymbion oneisti]|uniref:ATP-binding cassette domain-containing protein n=1 Tax=Candidatus Thiosymbion oneisti TaxID=589554 RepID=UPI000ACA49A2|nr:ATP-binding cassette domain-containing protein [Candidatus Thiosymbion oneisti]